MTSLASSVRTDTPATALPTEARAQQEMMIMRETDQWMREYYRHSSK